MTHEPAKSYTSRGYRGLPPMSPGFQQSLDRQFLQAEIDRKKADGEDVTELEVKLEQMPGVT